MYILDRNLFISITFRLLTKILYLPLWSLQKLRYKLYRLYNLYSATWGPWNIPTLTWLITTLTQPLNGLLYKSVLNLFFSPDCTWRDVTTRGQFHSREWCYEWMKTFPVIFFSLLPLQSLSHHQTPNPRPWAWQWQLTRTIKTTNSFCLPLSLHLHIGYNLSLSKTSGTCTQ